MNAEQLAARSVKQFEKRAWVTPLVGAGIGAAGGAMSGSLDTDDATVKRSMIRRALLGALFGGTAGLGLQHFGRPFAPGELGVDASKLKDFLGYRPPKETDEDAKNEG